jgi:hypothetical protein
MDYTEKTEVKIGLLAHSPVVMMAADVMLPCRSTDPQLVRLYKLIWLQPSASSLIALRSPCGMQFGEREANKTVYDYSVTNNKTMPVLCAV